MDQVYTDLYDIVEKKLEENHMQMDSTRDTFMTVLHADTSLLSGETVKDLDNLSFLETAYVILLKRLPDKDAMEIWSYYAKSLPKEKFRKELLETLVDSKEYITKGGKIKHNMIMPIKTQVWKAMEIDDVMAADQAEDGPQQEAAKEGMRDKLYKLYIKMPTKFRVFLRKIFRRGNAI